MLTLPDNEASRLKLCESIIIQGIKTFHEVGCALAEIRDLRLYRLTHATFEEYTREKWGLAARTANQRIAASKVVDLLRDTGAVPQNEAVARALVNVDPSKARAAWLEALRDDTTITAEKLRKLVMRDKHNSQHLAPVSTTTCPACGHSYMPWKPETASRGSRQPSQGLAWALHQIGPLDSILDYGCGRFRNAGLFEKHCPNVGFADTEEQCRRLAPLVGHRSLVNIDQVEGGWDCIAVICVLHILPEARRFECARRLINLSPRYMIIETPLYQQHYDKLRVRREGGFYFKLTNETIKELFPCYNILETNRITNNRTMILHRRRNADE